MQAEDLEAIVVGSIDVGESSRIVRLLTADHGRVSAMARGARASKKRWRGLLDPGVRLRVTLRHQGGDRLLMTGADATFLPRRAREDLDRVALLAYGCELCAALAPENQGAPRLFGLLATWLELLEDVPELGPASRVALEAKALTFAGLAPVLSRCGRCGEPLDDPASFDPEAGGAVHARCGGGAPIAAADAAEVEALRRLPLAETRGRDLPTGFRWLLSDFARWHTGAPLRSRELLRDIEGLPKGPGSG